VVATFNPKAVGGRHWAAGDFFEVGRMGLSTFEPMRPPSPTQTPLGFPSPEGAGGLNNGSARAVASGHMLTTVFGHFQYALLPVARRDAATTAPLAEAVVKLAREALGDREGCVVAMRRGIATCHDMGNAFHMTLFETALRRRKQKRASSKRRSRASITPSP